MKYYIKKLGNQELGSIGSDGKAKRGRYIYISKADAVLELFPPLSVAVFNDSALLPIIPLYQATASKIYCNFIYHNDKFTRENGTRNEYRIYSNHALEQGQHKFAPDDIVVFRKSVLSTEDEEQTVYFMELLNKHDSETYRHCAGLIANSQIKGNGHAVYEGEIPEMENKIRQLMQGGLGQSVIDDTVTKRVHDNPDALENLFNSNSFHDFVLNGYQYKCAVTRTVMRYQNYMNLEAAHIMPKSHGGTFLPDNGLALSRDMHWAFDKGFYTLDDELCVRVHPQISSDFLMQYDKKKINVPKNNFFVPNLENIRYHRENVYGLFLTSGRL